MALLIEFLAVHCCFAYPEVLDVEWAVQSLRKSHKHRSMQKAFFCIFVGVPRRYLPRAGRGGSRESVWAAADRMHAASQGTLQERLLCSPGLTDARAHAAQPRCCCTDGSWVSVDAASTAANCCCGDSLNMPTCCPNLGSSLCVHATCSALAIGTIFLLVFVASCCLAGCLIVRRVHSAVHNGLASC